MSNYVETAEDIKINIEEIFHSNWEKEFVITVQGKNIHGDTYIRQGFVDYCIGNAIKLKLEENNMSVTGEINRLREEIEKRDIAIMELKALVHDCFLETKNEMVLFNAEGAFQNRDKLIAVLRSKRC